METWPPKLTVCVGTVVLQAGKVLFVRQAENHPLARQWSIPWGVVDPGEGPETAAIRETLEEGGITAQIDGLIGTQNLEEEDWIALIYLCHHLSGEPRSDGGMETDAAAYFSLEEMETFDGVFEPWCQWLVQRVLNGNYHLIPPETDNPYRPRMAFF